MALDSTGYSSPDITELVDSMSATAVQEFGALIDTSADSALGHFIGVTSLEILEAYEDLAELYSNLNPNSSEGRMLENIALFGGLIRKNRAFSTGIVTFTGTPGTDIPESTVIHVNGDNDRRFLTRSLDTVGPGGTVSVRVIAETAGATAAPAGTLTELEVAIPGITSVTNAKDITVGTDNIESDSAFRSRRNATLSIGGNGTALAIKAALQQLDGVTAVRVIVNDTFSFKERGDGVYQRPPNSVECVVEGGDEVDIIETIVLTKSATSEAFGLTMAQYTDFLDNIHQVRYSRPALIDVTIEVSYRIYDEETFPEDGESRIVQEILDFAEVEYDLGVDLLVDRLCVPIFNVPGIKNVDIRVGKGDALPSASLVEDDIPIELFEKANITESNISVINLT